MHSVSEEIRYRLLRYLEEHPEASQRDLAQQLGVSVGKINYCVRALVVKGLIKMRNFRKSKRKLAYAYVLTPKGIEEKVDLTYRFLKWKIEEYATLKSEIERLQREVEQDAGGVTVPQSQRRA